MSTAWVVTIAIVGVAGVVSFWYKNGELLVAMRDAMFTDFDTDTRFLTDSPDRLRARGFRIDTQEDRDRWARRVATIMYLGKLDVIRAMPDLAERAKSLVRLYSRGGGDKCGTIDDLREKLQRMPEGYGCCSDHSEAFLALAPLVGLDGREIVTSLHTVIEYFDPAAGAWVFIDPMLGLMARDADGTYLSMFELRRRILMGQAIEFERFGHPGQVEAAGPDLVTKYYGSPDTVRRLRLLLGTNVCEVERFNARYHRLPKTIRHLIGHLRGVIPRHLAIVDDHNRQNLRVWRRWAVLAKWLAPRNSQETLR